MADYYDFYENNFKQLVNKPKFKLKNMEQILKYLAKKMETSYNNNIGVHFIKRITRFMNITNPVPLRPKDNNEIKSTKRNKFNKVINSILLNKIQDVPDEYKDWAINIKNEYLPADYIKKIKD